MLVWLLMLASIIGIRFMIPDAIGEKKKKLIFLGLAFCIVVFVLGSRSEHEATSGDLAGYLKWYDRAIDLPLSQLLNYTAMEEGYLVLNDILAWIVPWNQFIFYFQAAFCTGIMFWYIYRNLDNVFLGVIVYICLGAWQFFLTAFRQSIAICICFIAFELIKKRKTGCDVAALLLIFLASTMHTTAWVFLIVFIIRYLKPGRKVVMFTGLITVFMLMFIDDLVAFGNDTLGRVYETGEYIGNVFGGVIPILIYVATLILCYIVWITDKSFVDDYALEINMLILGLCLYTLRYNTLVFERISFYFTPIIAIVLPAAITRQKKDSERRISSAICIGACVALFIYRTIQQYGEYNFYWEYTGII